MKDPLPPDRWNRVTELFAAALNVDPSGRAAWLDEQCAGDEPLRREIESLLGCDMPGDADTALVDVVGTAIAEAAAAAEPIVARQRLGPYRVIREIGQGGMATVFLAVRDDDEFHQRVAIKVIRGVPSVEALRRFRAERQVLASLEHPSIARLLDGGTTADGSPYFVMEYVEGLPIDRYCEERQLTIRDRLALFTGVCHAVTHAHRSLVVHRDIKPSNILVTTDGVPKLLDFGIAKLLGEEADGAAPSTQTGMRALTPEYASPEQVRGEPITTATDVYSLGVLLFELLAGVRPLAFATGQPGEVERVVCTVEPRKPSTAAAPGRDARQIAGDLDTIVLTALRKEPARRYQSPADLAEDIRHYLDGRPIFARPATWRYRSSRFVRRHRAGVAVAAAIAVLVAGFAVALGLQMRRVARERDTADRVSALLLELYSSYDPSESRGGVTAQEILDRGALRIQTELTGQPDAQARMLDAFGTLYTNIGRNDRAEDVLRAALSLRQSGRAETLETARTLDRLAAALYLPAQFPEAESLARRGLDIRRRLAAPRSPETAESLNTLGLIQFRRGHGIEAAASLTEAIAIWRSTKDARSTEFAEAVGNLVLTWRERSDYLKAEQFDRADLLNVERFDRELLANRRKALGEVHALTGASLSTLGELLACTGRHQEAEPILRDALAVRRAVFGRDDHTAVIESLHNVAATLHGEGRLTEAEPLYRRAADLLRRVPGVHPQLAITLNNLATVLEDQRRFSEAEAAYREAIALRRQLLGRDHPGVARIIDNLARLLLAQARHADAMPAADEALAIRRATLGDRHYETAVSMITRARILAALGRRAEAEPLLRAGHVIRAAALPKDDPRLREDQQLLAGLR